MISHLTHIFKDTIFYGGIGTLSKLAAIFITPIVVRAFDAADYGIVDALRVLSMVLSGLALFALEQAAARNISIEDDVRRKREIAGQALVIAFLATMVVMVASMLFANSLANLLIGTDSSDVVSSIYLLALSIPGAVCNAFALMLLRWNFKRKEYAFCAVGGAVLLLGLTFYFVVYLNQGITGVFVAQLLASLFSVLLLIYYCREYISIVNLHKGCRMVKYAFPLSLMSQLANVQPMIERFVIIRFIGLEGLGSYAVAQAAGKVGRFPADSLYMAWYPYYAKIFRDKSADSLELVLVTGYVLVSAVWLFIIHYSADAIISLFAGSGYGRAAQLLSIVLAGFLFEVGASIVGIKVLLVGKSGRWASLYIFQGLAFVAVSFALADSLGLIGIAYAFLCSRVIYFFAACAMSIYVARDIELLRGGIDK